MAIGEHNAVEPGLIPALARHLGHLKDHPDGGELYQLIQDALLYCRQHDFVNTACVAHLHNLLSTYTKDHTQPSPVRVRARLIQQYLALYLPRHAKTKPSHSIPNPSSEVISTVLEPSFKESDANVLPVSLTNHSDLNETPRDQLAADAQPTASQKPALDEKNIQKTFVKRQEPTKNPNRKNSLIAGMDELLRERETLAKQLEDANAYLKMIEAEREQLRAELNKKRKRSKASDKTSRKLGLPKRDVLLRQIEAEVERVKRHGNPLALALIDVDDRKSGDSPQAQEVAKAALEHYTSEILGNFRSYDLVARYNKDEFAVLLPNADKENAARALEKIRKRASESHFRHNGRNYPLPSFGGVLTFYTPGEEPQQMLRRADEALVNLKLRGENDVVIV